MGATYSLTKDTAFYILQNSRRRAVVRYLLEYDNHDQFSMREVVEQIAAWEHDTTVKQLTDDQRQRVYVSLYQSHFPTLDDHNVIKYDQGRGIIEPTPLLGVFRPYVRDSLYGADNQLSLPSKTDESEERGLAETVTGFLSK